MFAGRFAPEKHLDVLAAAVDRLGAPYTLLAIGAGPRPPSGARVRVLPFIAGTAELAQALASADAFVHAGDQETFGLSLLEAMACATPVVARRAGGLAELVDDSVGIGVDANDPALWAEAIAALFASDLGPRRARPRDAAPKPTTGNRCCRGCCCNTGACWSGATLRDDAPAVGAAALRRP